MKTCLIRQPAGLGDIFFLLKVGNYYSEQNYQVVFPVLDHLLFIKDYLVDSGIEFIPISSKFEYKEYLQGLDVVTCDDLIYLPLQDSSWQIPGPIMESKYKMAGVGGFEDWQDSFRFRRNKEKEKALYYDVLGLTDRSEYIFTNRIYASLPNPLELTNTFQFKYNYTKLKLRIVEGFNPFDWCMVLEKAKEIHTVGTSICFLMERSNVTSDLNYYKRPQQDAFNFDQEKILFKQPWKFVC